MSMHFAVVVVNKKKCEKIKKKTRNLLDAQRQNGKSLDTKR